MSSCFHSVLFANLPRCSAGGADTGSISISFCLWELSQRSDVMKKLQREIDQAMPDARHPPDINTLQSLPYLNSFIKEG